MADTSSLRCFLESILQVCNIRQTELDVRCKNLQEIMRPWPTPTLSQLPGDMIGCTEQESTSKYSIIEAKQLELISSVLKKAQMCKKTYQREKIRKANTDVRKVLKNSGTNISIKRITRKTVPFSESQQPEQVTAECCKRRDMGALNKQEERGLQKQDCALSIKSANEINYLQKNSSRIKDNTEIKSRGKIQKTVLKSTYTSHYRPPNVNNKLTKKSSFASDYAVPHVQNHRSSGNTDAAFRKVSPREQPQCSKLTVSSSLHEADRMDSVNNLLQKVCIPSNIKCYSYEIKERKCQDFGKSAKYSACNINSNSVNLCSGNSSTDLDENCRKKSFRLESDGKKLVLPEEMQDVVQRHRAIVSKVLKKRQSSEASSNFLQKMNNQGACMSNHVVQQAIYAAHQYMNNPASNKCAVHCGFCMGWKENTIASVNCKNVDLLSDSDMKAKFQFMQKEFLFLQRNFEQHVGMKGGRRKENRVTPVSALTLSTQGLQNVLWYHNVDEAVIQLVYDSLPYLSHGCRQKLKEFHSVLHELQWLQVRCDICTYTKQKLLPVLEEMDPQNRLFPILFRCVYALSNVSSLKLPVLLATENK